MKGIVFIQLHELIEKKWGEGYLELLIEKLPLTSQGVYTAIGNYHSSEITAYITQISLDKAIDANELIKMFGHHMGKFFIQHHGHYFYEAGDTFTLLKRVDTHIHVDVKKIHSDASLPSFHWEHPSPDTLILFYQSKRDMAALAQGLIEVTAEHFKEDIKITRQPITNTEKHTEKFTLIRNTYAQ